METLSHPHPTDLRAVASCPVCGYAPRLDCRLCASGPPHCGPRFPPLDLVRGFGFYAQGALRVLNDKAFLGKIGWAMALALGLLVVLAALFLYLCLPWAQTLAGWLPGWISGALTALLAVMTAWFLFPVVISMFLFPVLDPLARLAEADALGFAPPPSRRGAMGDFWDSIDTGARILLYQAAAYAVCLPLALSVVGLPIAVAVSAFFAGFAWLDYPASRRALGFRDKWRLARRHWALLIGFGLAFQVGLLIPFFNPFLIGPAGAVGAADLYFACDKTGLPATTATDGSPV